MLHVDKLFQASPKGVAKKHGTEWCHLWVAELTQENIEELHRIAKQIGLKREYFQCEKLWFPHYDLTPTKRKLAIAHGAVEKDLYEWIKGKGGLKTLNQHKGVTS